ncbi:methyltransferase domain-containing protein [Actinoplanes sp. NPDC026623]|uniref:methyltransferase domain-containing protein n=1 Tax=Actinoplanes sp. NPDC026623 TaxID=3155610 RepID=UPI0033F514FB
MVAVVTVANMDWAAWHDDYDDPGSVLARRLAVVQDVIRAALDGCPQGPLAVVSMCAGQGRDLIGVLATHPRRADVRARLVELDPRSAAVAEAAARAAGLGGIEVVRGDAGRMRHYRELAPADLVLVCGVFGNVTDADVLRSVEACARLCRVGGTVVWTRHRRPPDLVPQIRGWFSACGFEEAYASDAAAGFGVGAHRLVVAPASRQDADRIFSFVESKQLRLA